MSKRKPSAKEKAEKKRRKQGSQTVFVNGKMKRVRRPPTIEGMPPEEFIKANADPIWLHQNGLWEYLEEEPAAERSVEAVEKGRALSETQKSAPESVLLYVSRNQRTGSRSLS